MNNWNVQLSPLHRVENEALTKKPTEETPQHGQFLDHCVACEKKTLLHN